MSNVLVLGAGLVAGPLVQYLLDKGVHLTVASRTQSKADVLIAGHTSGTSVAWTVTDLASLDKLVSEHDVAISLLPATMHVEVARVCLKHGKHMITTSYVSPEMQALDDEATKADVLLINELGVDPGIDHMSAMKIIHHVQNGGGKVRSFRSYCGGLPAPDANTNPWGYKFSWSPMAVLRAGTNNARYLKNGKDVAISSEKIFWDTHAIDVDSRVGRLESYPNRDSMEYVELYGLQGIKTMFRGTLRYPGWCETLRRLGELGLLNNEQGHLPGVRTWAELMAWLVGVKDTKNIRQRVASFLWIPADSSTMEKLQWLGVLDNSPLPEGNSIMEKLSSVMQAKMMYAEGEKDMIVMHHDFVADYPDRSERITSSLVDFGIPGGDSSMARTVGLPAAIATRMVLDGTIKERGVRIPVEPEVYNPILDELATLDIALKEETTPL